MDKNTLGPWSGDDGSTLAGADIPRALPGVWWTCACGRDILTSARWRGLWLGSACTRRQAKLRIGVDGDVTYDNPHTGKLETWQVVGNRAVPRDDTANATHEPPSLMPGHRYRCQDCDETRDEMYANAAGRLYCPRCSRWDPADTFARPVEATAPDEVPQREKNHRAITARLADDAAAQPRHAIARFAAVMAWAEAFDGALRSLPSAADAADASCLLDGLHVYEARRGDAREPHRDANWHAGVNQRYVDVYERARARYLANWRGYVDLGRAGRHRDGCS